MLNNRKSKVALRLFTFISIFVPIFIILSDTIANDYPEIVTIYHTNDMHSRLDSQYTSDGKLVQIGADVIKTVKDNTPNSILVDAGDATQGTLLGTYSRGADIINLMNLAGYDIMVPGNHEFDYGIDSLKQNVKSAEFPIISANLLSNDKSPFLKNDKSNGCNVIRVVGNKKIGFFALTTSKTKYETNSDNIEGIIFEDELLTAKNQVNYLKEQKVDAIIGITHTGNTETIVKENPDINVMIDGHSHEEYTKFVGNTVIQQTGSLSKKLGKIEIQFDETGKTNVHPQIINAEKLLNPLDDEIIQYTPDQNIEKSCEEILDIIKGKYSTVIGKIESTLYGGSYENISINRLQDSNLGNLICDSLVIEAKKALEKSGAGNEIDVVSVQNGGGIRTSILNGVVSYGDVLNVSPFDNNMIIKEVTPKDIFQILENGVKSIYLKDGMLQGTDGAFPNVGGMRFEFDINAQPTKFSEDRNSIVSHGDRIKKIVLLNEDGTDKKELSKDDSITKLAFASNNFTISGGDQYIMIKDLRSICETDAILHDMILNYIRDITVCNDTGKKYYSKDSRCKIVDEEKMFSSFDATATLKNNSTTLNNKIVKVRVDDGDIFEALSDSNGNIKINNLLPGAHDISIKCEEFVSDFYVNNKLGIVSPSVTLINNVQKNTKDTVSIINDIKNQPSNILISYINFARKNYDLLSESEKHQVSNYETLLLYEKNLNKSKYDNKKKFINFIIDNRFYLYSFLILIYLIVRYVVIRKSSRKKINIA